MPPWTPAAPVDPAPPPEQVPPDGLPPEDMLPPAAPPAAVPPPPVLAPAKRFGGVRRSLGNYARSGDEGDLRRGLGHYIRRGYGGSNIATMRFNGTAQSAGALAYALSSTAAGDVSAPLDARALAGRTTEEIVTAIIQAVRPTVGTQDAEAERAAMHDAMSDLLAQFPEADLLNLTDPERDFVIERFTALDVARRFELDVCKHLLESAPTATVAMRRLVAMRAYIVEAVAASFRRLRDRGLVMTARRVAGVVQAALRDTFEVFEGYGE